MLAYLVEPHKTFNSKSWCSACANLELGNLATEWYSIWQIALRRVWSSILNNFTGEDVILHFEAGICINNESFLQTHCLSLWKVEPLPAKLKMSLWVRIKLYSAISNRHLVLDNVPSGISRKKILRAKVRNVDGYNFVDVVPWTDRREYRIGWNKQGNLLFSVQQFPNEVIPST